MARDMDKNELIRYIMNPQQANQGQGYRENRDYDQDRGFNGLWDFTKQAASNIIGLGQNIYNNIYNNRNPPRPQITIIIIINHQKLFLHHIQINKVMANHHKDMDNNLLMDIINNNKDMVNLIMEDNQDIKDMDKIKDIIK